MYLNEEVRVERREGGSWHRAIIEFIMNNGALVMVSWVNHDWDDSIFPPHMILDEADVAGG
eukprot:10459430-Ditylum_brightwellii.AAC.1